MRRESSCVRPTLNMRRVLGQSRRVSKNYFFPKRWYAGESKISDRDMAIAFVEARGHSLEIASGVVRALEAPGSGVGTGQMLEMVTRMAGRWEVGEDAGLNALAGSVAQEFAQTAGLSRINFTVEPPGGGTPFDCWGYEGMSIKQVAESASSPGAEMLAEYIECACSGIMACSTCQVYVHPDWFRRVGAPSESEEDMLELAHERKETSRLGCQLTLSKALDGMYLTIPNGANNIFDHIPFE